MKLEGEKNALMRSIAERLGYAWLDKRLGDIGDVHLAHRWCDGSRQEPRGHHAYLILFESDKPKEIIPVSFCPLDGITTKETRVEHCFRHASEHFGVKYLARA